MRVDGTYRNNQISGRASSTRAGQGEGVFNVGGAEAGTSAPSSSPVAPATSLDILLALQAVEDPILKKKKKAIGRGRSMLDALDQAKADLLAGAMGEGRLNHLMALIGQVRESTEPGLDQVLDEIELRVLVELAKQGRYPTVKPR